MARQSHIYDGSKTQTSNALVFRERNLVQLCSTNNNNSNRNMSVIVFSQASHNGLSIFYAQYLCNNRKSLWISNKSTVKQQLPLPVWTFRPLAKQLRRVPPFHLHCIMLCYIERCFDDGGCGGSWVAVGNILIWKTIIATVHSLLCWMLLVVLCVDDKVLICCATPCSQCASTWRTFESLVCAEISYKDMGNFLCILTSHKIILQLCWQ